jgi:hypothetical protein
MDEEKLTEMSVDIKWIKSTIEKHIALHSKLFFAGVALAGSLILALVMVIISGGV